MQTKFNLTGDPPGQTDGKGPNIMQAKPARQLRAQTGKKKRKKKTTTK